MIYTNAKIFKTPDEIIQKGFILVENGLIKQVDDMENCPNFNKSVNWDGLEVYPGFIDAHSHIGMWEDGIDFEGSDGNEETDPILPQVRAIDSINPMDYCFHEAVNAGITTVVTGPGSANPIGGSFVAMKTFGNCVDDMIIKDPVGIKFALGENPKHIYNEKDQTPITRMGIVALIREQLEKARRYKMSLQKLKNNNEDLDELEFDFKCESLLSLLDRKTKAFFHCHRADDIYTAIRIAKEFNLDYVLVHATEGHLIAKSLEGVNIISGPVICDRSKPELRNQRTYNTAKLVENNANVAICTDHPVIPSQYILLSCGIAIKNGVSKQQAISSITKTAAEVCGIYDKVGSIEKGKLANFVAFGLNEDIFSPFSEPKYVVIDGNIVN